MNKNTKLIAIIMALCIIFCAGCGAGDAPAASPTDTPAPAPSAQPEKADIPQDNLGYAVGKTMPDFSFTTCDGQEKSLYTSLAEKELVLINIWATWCGPCGMEFPYMEEAYQQYSDRVEIFALSCESADSDEILASYAAEKGMSFPVGRDSAGLASTFSVMSIPTSIYIDRYGTICAIESGAMTSTEAFTSIFENFTAENYGGYADPDEAPVCDVAPSSVEELAAALNAEGGSIVFKNVENEHVWPMLVGEKDGRSVAASSNAGIDSSTAAVTATVSAKAGQVLRIDFALSGEEAVDLMKIYVDGQLLKCFGGEKDWMSYAFAFAADGEYQIIISYEKDPLGSSGEDCLRLDSIELLSGEEAEKALQANPRYIRGEATSLRVTSPEAREIVFDDPQHILLSDSNKDIFSFWIVPGGEAQLLLTVDESADPESLLFFADFDGSYAPALSGAAQSGYGFATGVDSMETSGYAYTSVYVEDTATASLFRAAICFADIKNLEAFLSQLVDEDGNRLVTWAYAESGEEAEYTVRYTDQNGNGVPGVVLQVCDDSICQLFTSDDKGECSFTMAPYAYELHTLKLPDGYSNEGESILFAPEDGGVIEIKLNMD